MDAAAAAAAAAAHSSLGAALRPPPPFDFDSPSTWPAWLLQFEDFSYATGLHTAEQEVQTRSMLYCMGPQARTVLASTTLSEADTKDLSAVKKAFTDLFVHPVNELYESARFHRRTQQPGETADVFFTALRTMVKRCNYASPAVEDRLVRDRFVVGLLDRKLSDQLCRCPKLTLQEALTQARQHEDADNERKIRNLEESPLLAVDATRVQKGKLASDDRPARLCSFCGRASHPRTECPARRAVCNFCGKTGHFEVVCMKKKVGGKQKRKPSANSVELHAVAGGRRPNAKFIEVLVDGRTLSFKVDSGAEVSVVPSAFPGIPAKLQNPEGELKGPGNNVLPVLGTYNATLTWHGKSVKQQLYVLAADTVPLLGFPAIQALGVCKFLDHVSEAPEPCGQLRLDPALFQGLGTLPETYTIRLIPDATPFSLSVPRRLPLPLRDPIKAELDKLERDKVIRRVDTPTPWCAGMVAVRKASGGYRLCVDLTRLNKVILRERHMLPTVEQCLGLLGEATVFSKLDATSSFHQVKLSPESQEFTTFITPFGRYCFLRLPFGIATAPEYFQRQMSRILEGQVGVVNMIDDILVFGKTRAEHDRRLQEVLTRITNAGVKLNRDKCTFGASSVKFLGVVVGTEGISPDPDKVAAIKGMPAPQDVSGVRRLLGLVNHIGRFLPRVSETTAPIRALLRKESEWTWGHAQQTAFSKLKEMLCSDICMARYNTAYKTTVSADASSFGLGAVLLQEQPSGERRPVAFASRSLTPTESRYSQTEKEALAACWAVLRFEEYVRGLNFFIETDHQPLLALMGTMDVDLLPPRIQRFRLKLMRFTYQVLYVPGKLLATADTLSRAPLDGPPPRHADHVELFVGELLRSFPDFISSRKDELRHAQASDGECNLLLEYCNKGWPRQSRLPLHVKKYWQYRGDFSVCEGLLLKGVRIVVPSALQRSMLDLIHDGHQGINRCKAIARESVWWPGVNSHIETLVSNCATCAETRVQRAEPMIPSQTPSLPWEEVGVDLFHLKGQDYVLLVDYRSRFPEVISLRSTTAPAVIAAVKSVFARHGIPRVVRSDNGPQFSSKDFSAFSQAYGFEHVTSSPRFPQSNGEVERMVRTVKDLLLKADDPYLALLAYRDTPGINGVSPAQLLMGRRLQTRVPKTSQQLEPQWPSSRSFNLVDQANRRKQALDFNRRHAAHPQRPLRSGEQVWVRDINSPALVLGPAQRPRSYVVETPKGVIQRNRLHLVPVSSSPVPNGRVEPATEEQPESEPSELVPPAQSSVTSPQSQSPSSPTRVSRYGRVIRRPRKLNL